MCEKKAKTLTGLNGEVPVSDELYQEVKRIEWAEEKRQQRAYRCRYWDKQDDGSMEFVTCDKKCEECAYWLAGGEPLGYEASVEACAEEGLEIASVGENAEESLIRKEMYEPLYAAIEGLRERDKAIIKMR